MRPPGRYASQQSIIAGIGREYNGPRLHEILNEVDKELRRSRAVLDSIGSGGAAPDNASYWTMAAESGLSGERVPTGTSRISITDNGPNSTAVIDAVGAALTRVDDTNVTLTLGGSPTTALVNAASLTLGWTGLLSVPRGGTGIGSYVVGSLIYASASTTLAQLTPTVLGSYLRSTSLSTPPTWSTLVLPDAITSGAILYGSATNVAASSAMLAANGVVYGGGAGVAPAATAAGTTGQVLIGNTGAAPSFGSVPASALDADLVAIAALTGTGFATRIADDDWALRTFAAGSDRLTISNPGGVAGAPSFDASMSSASWDWTRGITVDPSVDETAIYARGTNQTAGSNTANLFEGANAAGLSVFQVRNTGRLVIGRDDATLDTFVKLDLQVSATQSANIAQVVSAATGASVTFWSIGSTGKMVAGVAPQIDIASAAAGSIFYSTDAGGNTLWTGAGTSSQVLIGGAAPSWGSIPAAALDVDLQEIAALANVQGDLLFTNATPAWALLAKDTNATRYLSNTGTSNAPAWAQVALATGISGFAAGVATFLATPSSANLLAAVTNETGTGALVFATSPTFVTPLLGTPTSGVLTNATGLPLAGLVPATAISVLVGRGSAAGAGAFQEITLGTGLTMTGTVLSAAGGAAVADNTASIGLTRLQGSAATAMRSDGAPPLDQGISPTWTGTHIVDSDLGGTMQFQSSADLFYLKDLVSGFTANVIFSAPPVEDYSLALPRSTLGTAAVTLVGTTAVQTMSNKTYSITGNLFRSQSASSGVAFADQATPTKLFRLILSGLVAGNNTLTFTGTNVRDWRFEDLSGSLVIAGNGADPPGADAAAKVNRTALTVDQGTAGAPINLTNSTPAGFHCIVAYLTCTTAQAATAVTLFATWTDDSGSRTRQITTLSLATAGNNATIVYPLYLASGNITWYADTTGTTGAFSVRIRVEYLGS